MRDYSAEENITKSGLLKLHDKKKMQTVGSLQFQSILSQPHLIQRAKHFYEKKGGLKKLKPCEPYIDGGRG